jgi:hypothetical protein
MRCEFHGSCRYLAQFRDPRPALRIFAHEYLFLGLPRGLPTRRWSWSTRRSRCAPPGTPASASTGSPPSASA